MADNLKILIPLIKQIHPSLIANNIVGVQPMTIEVFTSWKAWFAWYPVRLHSGQMVWMKGIYRREPYSIFSIKSLTNKRRWWVRPHKRYQYADDFDVLRS